MLLRSPSTSSAAARLLPRPAAIPLLILAATALYSGAALASESPSAPSSGGEQIGPAAVMSAGAVEGGGANAETATGEQQHGGPGAMSAEKRGWADMQHGWGKRGWADLRSAWGKRGWRDLQGGWGKRDWNSIRGAWGKRGTGSSWNNFRGSWGKRGNGEWGGGGPEYGVYDDGEEGAWGEDGPRDDSEDGGPYVRGPGAELEAAEAAAAAAEYGNGGYFPPPEYFEDKRSWGNLKGAWGKRAEEEDADGGDSAGAYGKRAWKNLKGSWGKRDPGWHNLKGLWGKRAPAAKWNKLTSVWGKRSIGGETGTKSMDGSLPSGV